MYRNMAPSTNTTTLAEIQSVIIHHFLLAPRLHSFSRDITKYARLWRPSLRSFNLDGTYLMQLSLIQIKLENINNYMFSCALAKLRTQHEQHALNEKPFQQQCSNACNSAPVSFCTKHQIILKYTNA